LALVEVIRTRNKNPIYIIGFSRGSVDAGRSAKTHPKSIEGIVLASGIYTNDSKMAEGYAMELVIGRRIETPILIVHHEIFITPVISTMLKKYHLTDDKIINEQYVEILPIEFFTSLFEITFVRRSPPSYTLGF
jgi:alpha-beta hydrolase superfamily lysophospholipase